MLPEDVPAMSRLYAQYITHKTAVYPKVGEQPTLDFAKVAMQQLAFNPNWFCVVAVDGRERVWGFGAAFVSDRPLSRPSPYGFCELIVVDEKGRERGIGERILMALNGVALARGAQVIECSYQPGTTNARIWEAAGFVPYTVMAAYIDPNTGESRSGVVQLPHGLARATIAPARIVPSEE